MKTKYMRELERLKAFAAGPGFTPNPSLPPLGNPPRRIIQITIEVSADFESRLDNQWMVEREIHADRWSWKWATDDKQFKNGQETKA